MAKKAGMSREFREVRDAGKKRGSGMKTFWIALAAVIALTALAVGVYFLVSYLSSGGNGSIRTNPITGELETKEGWLLHRSGSGEYYKVGETRAIGGFELSEKFYMAGKKPVYTYVPSGGSGEITNYTVQVVTGAYEGAVKNGYESMGRIATVEFGDISVTDIGGREVSCFYSVVPYSGSGGEVDHYTAFEDAYFRTGREDCCINVQITHTAKDRSELSGERALFNYVDNIVQSIAID